MTKVLIYSGYIHILDILINFSDTKSTINSMLWYSTENLLVTNGWKSGWTTTVLIRYCRALHSDTITKFISFAFVVLGPVQTYSAESWLKTLFIHSSNTVKQFILHLGQDSYQNSSHWPRLSMAQYSLNSAESWPDIPFIFVTVLCPTYFLALINCPTFLLPPPYSLQRFIASIQVSCWSGSVTLRKQ